MRDYVRLLRPQHWVKNAFVLAGLLFGHAFGNAQLVAAALGATAAFCLAASAVYALNDCVDAAQDRTHPDKRDRPVACGTISRHAAVAVASVLAATGLALAAWIGPAVAATVAGYVGLNGAYALGLKRVPVLDVFAIAGGFMLRLLAGTAGIGIPPSRWLLACGLLLTLFLGFGKRRAEIAQLAQEAGQHRPVLEAYSTGFLDKAILVCAAAMIVTYALYTVADGTVEVQGTDRLILSVPWVLLGTFRYLYRLNFRGGGGDPANELLRDPLIALAALGWLGTVVWLIA